MDYVCLFCFSGFLSKSKCFDFSQACFHGNPRVVDKKPADHVQIGLDNVFVHRVSARPWGVGKPCSVWHSKPSPTDSCFL